MPGLVDLIWGFRPPLTAYGPRITIEAQSQGFRPCLSYSSEVCVSSSCLAMGLVGPAPTCSLVITHGLVITGLCLTPETQDFVNANYSLHLFLDVTSL